MTKFNLELAKEVLSELKSDAQKGELGEVTEGTMEHPQEKK